ncbi:hypothetical protein MNBD_GAMMA09-2286 [hydrothermal vent metagenome]|uniref:Putative zinc-finger domain-containing protein n=1 Tax=hydrothermal vent metagenome TaxID=652676 RepID=A0A3B0XWR9_9ZZZZ
MNCTEVQTELDDYIDNDLLQRESQAVHMHINNCSACKKRLDEATEVREALKTLPLAEASDGFENRLFAEVRSQSSARNRSRFINGFSTAVAASLFLWVMNVTFFSPQVRTEEPAAITFVTNDVRSVRLLFDAPEDIQQVTLNIKLPANFEINGYPGRSQLNWKTRLKKGENVLTLPINALQKGEGELIAQVSYGDKQKIYKIRLKTTDNGVMTYQIKPLTSA